MRGSSWSRIAAVLLGFDVVFVAIASASFLTLVGAPGPQAPRTALIIGTGLHAVRIAVWVWLLATRMRPIEVWLRNGETAEPAALETAARRAYWFPLSFASVFALLWGATYVLLYLALFRVRPEEVTPALALPAALFAAATVLAAFPFVLLWVEYLLGGVRARISLALGAPLEVIGATRFSLRRRVLLLSLCLAFAPTFWVLSMVAGAMLRIEPRVPPEAVWTIGAFFLAVALWAPICAVLMVRTLARPIGSIASAMAAVARSRDPGAAAPIPVYHSDELGSLASRTNEMVERLTEELERRTAIAEENERLLVTARDAIRTRDRFLSIASHELRTPLTPLRLNLEHLERQLKELAGADEPGRAVEAARRQTERLVRLAEDLLDVAETGTGEIPLRRELHDLAQLTRDAASRIEADASRVESEVVVHAPGPAPALVDRRRIERVVTMLLDNALKFGAGKTIEVDVRASERTVRIAVSDLGPGIPQEDKDRIFERFERAVSELHYGGLGLGLYMARRIVEAHGGTLTVRSSPGTGSTFMVELPSPGRGAD